VVTGVSMHSVVRRRGEGEVPVGHQGEWNESKLSAISFQSNQTALEMVGVLGARKYDAFRPV
jgi:hypothetical protein